jgi:predicted DNA repair protein MutK
MPKLLSTLSAVGTVAMLWVGGHILLAGSDHLGWHTPYDLVHSIEDRARHSVQAAGAVLAWLVDTGASAVVGLIVGAVVVALMHLLSFVREVIRRPRD